MIRGEPLLPLAAVCHRRDAAIERPRKVQLQPERRRDALSRVGRFCHEHLDRRISPDDAAALLSPNYPAQLPGKIDD